MSGYVNELYVSSSSKHGHMVQQLRLICWEVYTSCMHNSDTSNQMSFQYVLHHLFHVAIIYESFTGIRHKLLFPASLI